MTPTALITGFLGAGKTTLLEQLIPRILRAGRIPRILLNDFQNAAIDAARLRSLEQDVRPVNGSCICCGSRDDFLDTLTALPNHPANILLIEANGASDPHEILEMLAADRRAYRFARPIQLNVVDASRWQQRHWNNELEREQHRTASRLILTRADMVDSARLHQVMQDLAHCNPYARRVTAETVVDDLILARETVAGCATSERMPHAQHHLSACEQPLPSTVTRVRLLQWLTGLPGDVIRAKGVAFDESGRAVLFQRVDPFAEPTLMELGEPGDLCPVAVFIGPCLDYEALRRYADQLAQKSG